jgi:hypothetical protein
LFLSFSCLALSGCTFLCPSRVMFIRLIICTFQLVFSAETVFFSHNKSTNSVF